MVIDLLHDEEWTRRLAENPPRLLLAAGAEGKAFAVAWEKIEPGRYSARAAIPPGGWLRGVVQTGKERWPFGPVASGVDPEWNFPAERLQALRDLSRQSGGREIADLREVWQAPREAEFSDLGNGILGVLLLTFLAEVAVTRWRGRATG